MRGSGTRWVWSTLRDQRFAVIEQAGTEEMDKLRAILSAAILSAIAGVAFGAATAARAQDCPGHPDAIGTSRVVTIDPGDYQRLGTLNYQQTLPLNDHEVVLTFDDGPLPPKTPQILDIL